MGTPAVAVVTIHGMGWQQEGYADRLATHVDASLRRDGIDPEQVAWAEVHWADITEGRQQRFYQDSRRLGRLGWLRSRRIVVQALGDAAAYQRGGAGSTYQRIHQRIAETIRRLFVERLGGSPVPLVVVAHSLGTHIASNYIWDAHHTNRHLVSALRDAGPFERMGWLAGLVTLGSNLPLFTFALDDVVPIDLPGPFLPDRLARAARWINLYDRDDVLAYPLGAINDRYARLVDDRHVAVGGLWGWTPASHLGYWADREVTRAIGGLVADLIRAAQEGGPSPKP